MAVRVFRIDDLVEVALCAFAGYLFHQKREAVAVKLLEELLPGDLLEVRIVRVRSSGELEAKDTGLPVVLCCCYLCGPCTALVCPLLNLIVILNRSRKRHPIHPFWSKSLA